MNRLAEADSAAHDWYRFVLSYPAHLVRHYLDRFGIDAGSTVLDPFCGTGTTLVECKKHGIGSIGIEAHPMTAFASRVKVDWRPDPAALIAHAEQVAAEATERFAANGDNAPLRTLPAEATKLLLANSISPLPLHKTLGLLDVLQEQDDARFTPHERLALAQALVYSISNLHFGPEVGVGKPKADAPVVDPWLSNVRVMARDLTTLQEAGLADVPARVINADARDLLNVLEPASVDAIICSPPYPNEKDYTRTTRLETVLLGFAETKAELQTIKRGLVRSNTRTVYKGDDDDQYVSSVPEIERIAREIEERRLELGKTSGFERLYHRVTKLYFGGMAKHFADLRTILKPGAHLAYVVGDQASYLRVMIRTGQLLAEIAERLGYEVVSLDLFRTRLATASREQLREEVVVLRWPGWAP
ncbi:MAG: DNA methyltransferase [Thermomicrobiales bacterium]